MSVTQLVRFLPMQMLKIQLLNLLRYGDFFGIGDVSDIEELLVGVPYEYEYVLAKLKTIDTTLYFSRMTTEEVAKAIVA
mgnify:CR=1 FL=1